MSPCPSAAVSLCLRGPVVTSSRTPVVTHSGVFLICRRRPCEVEASWSPCGPLPVVVILGSHRPKNPPVAIPCRCHASCIVQAHSLPDLGNDAARTPTIFLVPELGDVWQSSVVIPAGFRVL